MVAAVAGVVYEPDDMLVAVAAPSVGVTSVGLVANTAAPEPVSSVRAAARFALEGVARNVATLVPRPDMPDDTGNPVQLVSVPLDGVPSTGVTSVGLVRVLFVSVCDPANVTSPTARLPLPTMELLFMVFMFEPDTSASCNPVTMPVRPLTLATGPPAILAALAAAATALLFALLALFAAAVALLEAAVALPDADVALPDADVALPDAAVALSDADVALLDAAVALFAAAVALAAVDVLSELFSAF